MGSQTYNPSDLNSPGYEYLRSYSAMGNLYHKLIALDYQKEFCPLYKCPPINKFYFAVQSANQIEQQFAFMCLCVWLIKDKCQMNFDTDPREYQDLDATIDVIFEALKLLLGSDRHKSDERNLFPLGRLRQGYGPEVIYCLNKFADRALELELDDNPKLGQVEIYFYNKQKGSRNDQSSRPRNSIIIGQPIVGGGLTTRPLGNYQVDDTSLIFDYRADATNHKEEVASEKAESNKWDEEKLDKIAPLFDIDYDNDEGLSWQDLLGAIRKARIEVSRFINQTKPARESISMRIERQMRVITVKETSLNTNLKDQIEVFARTWRDYSDQSKKNADLNKQINHKVDTFEHYVEQLKALRTKEVKLNDDSELIELERLTKKLECQTKEMDLKIGLLLAASCQVD